MSHVGAPRGRTCSRTLRSVAFLASGVLALPALSACSSDDGANDSAAAAADIASVPRKQVAQGGTLRWAVDTLPATLNVYQADADASTGRIAGAVLPSLFALDERGRPQLDPDYLESAKVVDREPKQVVLYRLNQQAVWSDGREIGAPDFVAQWHALRGKDSAYWTARNAGYERIEKIQRGADDLEVRVTFNKPYADWKSLFSPLYPKDVTQTASSFNEGARTALRTTAGPFSLKALDRKGKKVTLVRNPRWWGDRAKLDSLVLTVVPRSGRAAALAAGQLDVAEIDRTVAERISSARAKAPGTGGAGQPRPHGTASTTASDPKARARTEDSEDGDSSSDEKTAKTAKTDKSAKAEAAKKAREKSAGAARLRAAEQRVLRGYVVRKSLENAYTQLALNGESGPLADERVRRAVARALNRQELADAVLKPLGLPAKPLGSHLALVGQQAYADSSDALGDQDTHEAQALLADAGWTLEGARKKQGGTKAGSEGEGKKTTPEKKDAKKDEKKSGTEEDAAEKDEKKTDEKKTDQEKADTKKADEKKADEKTSDTKKSDDAEGDDSEATSGSDGKQGRADTGARSFESAERLLLAEAVDGSGSGQKTLKQAQELKQDTRQEGVTGAYAPVGTAVPALKKGPLGKDGKPLTLRFVLPQGQGSESLRTVGERISRMLERIGIGTEIVKVADDSFFKDHIASGDYDLALYSWPATAYPATDGRPIFAKPEPATDGSLLVEQNYTRVGTDHIDQLFDQAAAELDENAARGLLKQADARIWAAAGSIPLYQRPQLVAVKPQLMNVGAFGLASPRYQDIGFKQTASEVSKKK